MIVYPHVKPGDQLLVDGLTHEQEVKERRTSRGKTFDLGSNQFRLRSGLMPVHFHDGRKWQDVDLTVTERNGLVICDTAGYEVKFDRVVPSLTLEGPQGEAEVALDKVGGKSKVYAASYHVEGNEIVWEYNDYSIHAEVRPAAVEFYKLLKTPAAPRKFEWVIKNEKRNVKFNRKSAGQDKGKHNLQMVTSSDGNRYTEEWTGKVGVIADKKTRRKAWAAEAEYPILVDTAVQVGIVAAGDDGTQVVVSAPGSWATNKNYIGRGSYPYHMGLRFQAIGIPAGATIIGAKIRMMNALATADTGIGVILYGDLQADAPAFSASDLPTAIDKSVLKWTFPATVPGQPLFVSAAVTGIVQSIVDVAGWAANNDMRFAAINTGTVPAHDAHFASYPNPGLDPTIDIYYTTATPISMPRVRIGH